MTPTVLIVHTLEWPSAARLALAFRAADCRVSAVCRRGHALYSVSSIERIYPYRPFARLRSLEAAIVAADPDLIVPTDDPSVMLLHRLHSLRRGPNPSARRIRFAIERSVGRPQSYEPATTRSLLPALAEAADVAVPRTQRVASPDELAHWLASEGYPAVLKSDHSWGGRGVAIIRGPQEAAAAFRKMAGWHHLAHVAKRLLWEQDPQPCLQLLQGIRPVLTVQTFIPGKIANCSVVCWEGEVIAGIAVEVLATQGPTGNATVVRVVDGADMIGVARRIVRRLGGSGFFGFDFILDEASGRPVLLEVNPRATQISHLAYGPGRDLAAALRGRLTGEPIHEARRLTDRDIIAFFPQEWRRDPASSFLLTAYHDIPHDEPALIQAFLAAPSPARRVISQLRRLRANVLHKAPSGPPLEVPNHRSKVEGTLR